MPARKIFEFVNSSRIDATTYQSIVHPLSQSLVSILSEDWSHTLTVFNWNIGQDSNSIPTRCRYLCTYHHQSLKTAQGVQWKFNFIADSYLPSDVGTSQQNLSHWNWKLKRALTSDFMPILDGKIIFAFWYHFCFCFWW